MAGTEAHSAYVVVRCHAHMCDTHILHNYMYCRYYPSRRAGASLFPLVILWIDVQLCGGHTAVTD